MNDASIHTSKDPCVCLDVKFNGLFTLPDTDSDTDLNSYS